METDIHAVLVVLWLNKTIVLKIKQKVSVMYRMAGNFRGTEISRFLRILT